MWGASFCDRMYVGSPCYVSAKVVMSMLQNDRKAIVAFTEPPVQLLNKKQNDGWLPIGCLHAIHQHNMHCFCITSPSYTMSLLEASMYRWTLTMMYTGMCDPLESFYPEQEITVTSSNPSFATPAKRHCCTTKTSLCTLVVLKRQELYRNGCVHLLYWFPSGWAPSGLRPMKFFKGQASSVVLKSVAKMPRCSVTKL